MREIVRPAAGFWIVGVLCTSTGVTDCDGNVECDGTLGVDDGGGRFPATGEVGEMWPVDGGDGCVGDTWIAGGGVG